MMADRGKDHALDHVVVIMFENRSFDNLLGRLYEPGEVASFEGVAARTSPTRSRTGPSRRRASRSSRTGWPPT